MNKSERIADMLVFLQGKSTFQLKDLMKEYAISKRTALRDVHALEEIGLPLYSESGRYGCYKIISNKMLSSILFSVDEIFAMYFAMITLKDYETTPFHLSIDKLKDKFKKCMTKEKVIILERMEKLFHLGSIKHNNQSDVLGFLLDYTLEEKVCDITYKKNTETRVYTVQFFDISSAYGQWYATGYNFVSLQPHVFRCDKILKVKENKQVQSKTIDQLQQPASVTYRQSDAMDFEVEITDRGVDMFYKEHYPSMKLFCGKEKNVMKGFYNKGEENFIANYLIAYGDNILDVKPRGLLELLIDKLEKLKDYMLVIGDY